MRKHDGVRLTRRHMLSGLTALSGLAAIIPRTALARPGGTATAVSFDGTALVLAAGDVWRSENGGADWSALPVNLGSAVTALATHPDRPGRIWAALAAGSVAVSNDGGITWTKTRSGLPDGPGIALAVAAHQPDTLYLSVAGDGLWQSEDAGANWELAMDRPWLDGTERDVLALASVASPSGMGGIWVYAGTEVGLTRVPDCFCRWQDVQPGNAMDALVAGEAPTPGTPLPPGEVVLALALAPAAPEVIQAATPSGLWRSEDAGVTWTQTTTTPAQALAVDPANPDRIVAATEGGLLTSHDGGLTWAEPGT